MNAPSRTEAESLGAESIEAEAGPGNRAPDPEADARLAASAAAMSPVLEEVGARKEES
jgi:hypothetical protein